MKLETFFEKFELIADAPGAVARMRELVLELAVQGKLVEQIASEPSADELLREIEAARNARSRERGRGRKLESLSAVDPGEIPFDIPDKWQWCRLGSLGLISSSSRVHEKDWTTSGVPFFRAREIVQLSKSGSVRNELFITEEHYQQLASEGLIPEPNDIMITGVGTIGVPYVVRDADRFYFKDASVLIFKNCFGIYPHYLRLVMQSSYWDREIHKGSMGTTVHTLTILRAKQTPIPLPPLAEQKRIVVKVDELMALCDRLETQQQERETRHAALVRASLARFTEAPTPANLQFLFHPSYDVTPADFRKTILTLAVQGLLVPHDAESAAWETRKLKDLTTKLGSGSTPSGGKESYQATGVPLIRSMNVHFGGFVRDGLVFLSSEQAEKLKNVTVKANDVLLNITGASIGRVTTAPSDMDGARVNQHVCIVRPTPEISPRFLELFLASPVVQDLIQSIQVGATREALTKAMIEQFEIPLPPLAEQRRIVAKVEQLMALVDELEQQLAASRATAEKLLTALVAGITSEPSPVGSNGTHTARGSGEESLEEEYALCPC